MDQVIFVVVHPDNVADVAATVGNNSIDNNSFDNNNSIGNNVKGLNTDNSIKRVPIP